MLNPRRILENDTDEAVSAEPLPRSMLLSALYRSNFDDVLQGQPAQEALVGLGVAEAELRDPCHANLLCIVPMLNHALASTPWPALASPPGPALASPPRPALACLTYPGSNAIP